MTQQSYVQQVFDVLRERWHEGAEIRARDVYYALGWPPEVDTQHNDDEEYRRVSSALANLVSVGVVERLRMVKGYRGSRCTLYKITCLDPERRPANKSKGIGCSRNRRKARVLDDWDRPSTPTPAQRFSRDVERLCAASEGLRAELAWVDRVRTAQRAVYNMDHGGGDQDVADARELFMEETDRVVNGRGTNRPLVRG